MALINIEYGSLASSETMNKNFMYLDDKIAETSESIMTSISSILSNIATINSRLNDISENMNDSIQNVTTKMEEYKTKTKILVGKSTMVPDWSNCVEISLQEGGNYEVSSNGYLFMLPKGSSNNTLFVNDKIVEFKIKNYYDSYGQMMSIPVFDGDVLSTASAFNKVYFVPDREVSVENF